MGGRDICRERSFASRCACKVGLHVNTKFTYCQMISKWEADHKMVMPGPFGIPGRHHTLGQGFMWDFAFEGVGSQ